MDKKSKHKPPFCDENPIGCLFDVKNYPADTTI